MFLNTSLAKWVEHSLLLWKAKGSNVDQVMNVKDGKLAPAAFLVKVHLI